MVEPVGHRQTKGAATDMLEPKATASHLDSTNRVSLAACRSLPVFHEQRTSSDRPGMSQTCQLKNRHGRFRDCDLLRKLFETMVRRCMAEGLVDGAAFAVDASLIAADANKQRSAVGSADVDWEAIARTRRSVREYLDTLDEAALGRRQRNGTEVHLQVGSGRTMDRRSQRACLLCLRRQLPDRPEGGDHRRCRGDASYPAGRGRCGTHND